MGDTTDDLARLWRWFARHQFRGDSPIYERIATVVADDNDLLGLLQQSAPASHLPLMPLAASRFLLLEGLDHPLRDVYNARSDADPGSLFADFCHRHRTELFSVLDTRRVQTNDCGRSALIGPALTWAAHQQQGPLHLIDVGTSAGLNLWCDRYRLEYGPYGSTGPDDSPVRASCEVRSGDPPIADTLPELAARVGIDIAPVDLSDPRARSWLLACVWPDSGRAERVEASIRYAEHHVPPVVEGHANSLLPSVLDNLPADATAVVMTTWAFGYFSISERDEFVEILRTASQHRRVIWLSAENAGVVTPFASTTAGDVLGALLIDDRKVSATLLADAHPHGNWLKWHAPGNGRICR